MAKQPLQIIIDTREQRPLDFSGFKNTETLRMKLDTGDYSIPGHKIFIERKSLADLVSSLFDERFDREVTRMTLINAEGGWCGIIVEGTAREIFEEFYRAATHKNSVIGKVIKLIMQYKIPVIFLCNPTVAAWFVHRMFLMAHERGWYAEDIKKI